MAPFAMPRSSLVVWGDLKWIELRTGLQSPEWQLKEQPEGVSIWGSEVIGAPAPERFRHLVSLNRVKLLVGRRLPSLASHPTLTQPDSGWERLIDIQT